MFIITEDIIKKSYVRRYYSMKENGKTKIIVFSDSHGSSALMMKTAEIYRYSADYFIFLATVLEMLKKSAI